MGISFASGALGAALKCNHARNQDADGATNQDPLVLRELRADGLTGLEWRRLEAASSREAQLTVVGRVVAGRRLREQHVDAEELARVIGQKRARSTQRTIQNTAHGNRAVPRRLQRLVGG